MMPEASSRWVGCRSTSCTNHVGGQRFYMHVIPASVSCWYESSGDGRQQCSPSAGRPATPCAAGRPPLCRTTEIRRNGNGAFAMHHRVRPPACTPPPPCWRRRVGLRSQVRVSHRGPHRITRPSPWLRMLPILLWCRAAEPPTSTPAPRAGPARRRWRRCSPCREQRSQGPAAGPVFRRKGIGGWVLELRCMTLQPPQPAGSVHPRNATPPSPPGAAQRTRPPLPPWRGRQTGKPPLRPPAPPSAAPQGRLWCQGEWGEVGGSEEGCRRG